MKDKNKRRISILVTAQTAYNLRRLADLAGYHEPGMMVDKLVRDRLKLIWLDKSRLNGLDATIYFCELSEEDVNNRNQTPEFRTKYLGKWFFKNDAKNGKGG